MASNCGRREFVIRAGGGTAATATFVALAGCNDPEGEPQDGNGGGGYRDGDVEPDAR